VTVSGLDFGGYDLSVTAALSEAACLTSSWTSATTVACLSSASYQRALASTVTVGVSAGTHLRWHSFDAAVLSYTNLNSAVSGGSFVSVSGLDFGGYDLSVTAAV